MHLAADALRERLGGHVAIRTQVPLIVGNMSVPEPDIAVVPGSHAAYVTEHPTTALLVVEVAESSLGQDRLTKTRMYATAGIPQYLILNLRHGQVESYADPDPALGIYRATHLARRGEPIRLTAFADLQIDVDHFLPAH